jgi:8-oxo-dGTP pyrophosphatase MutT (NUDIX family)/GNAT superfamily N-acetyltransferase
MSRKLPELPPIVIVSELSSELDLFLDERLYEFNVRATRVDDGRMLWAKLEDETGTIIAAISGHTWGGCCEITRLWVHESRREQGLGRALLLAAEAEALGRGCKRMVLFTHSFQAPAFYEAQGYERRASIDDYPAGHAKYLYEKRLEPRQAEAVAAIIERGGKFLVGRRSVHKRSAPGYWCTVCGGVEPGESQAAAVVREVLEETGLRVCALAKFAECDTHDGSTRIHFWLTAPESGSAAASGALLVDGASNDATTEPRLLGDEHDAFAWVSVEEMRQLQPVFLEDVEIFARLVRGRKME